MKYFSQASNNFLQVYELNFEKCHTVLFYYFFRINIVPFLFQYDIV